MKGELSHRDTSSFSCVLKYRITHFQDIGSFTDSSAVVEGVKSFAVEGNENQTCHSFTPRHLTSWLKLVERTVIFTHSSHSSVLHKMSVRSQSLVHWCETQHIWVLMHQPQADLASLFCYCSELIEGPPLAQEQRLSLISEQSLAVDL